MMPVYKDMTFCMRICGNLKCNRNALYTQENDTGLPVAWSEFKDCDDFEEVPKAREW